MWATGHKAGLTAFIFDFSEDSVNVASVTENLSQISLPDISKNIALVINHAGINVSKRVDVDAAFSHVAVAVNFFSFPYSFLSLPDLHVQWPYFTPTVNQLRVNFVYELLAVPVNLVFFMSEPCSEMRKSNVEAEAEIFSQVLNEIDILIVRFHQR
ncbi:hypothetical protein ES703_100720 [subsurface metagenome]